MIKVKFFLVVVAAVVLVGLVTVLSVGVKKQRETIKFQREQIESLQGSLDNAIQKTAISFSISPSISHKVTSVFGCNKNVTWQYYFVLDGKAIIAKTDSVYYIAKEY